MRFTKKLGQYFRDKLGVTSTQAELTAKLKFLSAYTNAMLPERMHLSPEILKYSHEQISVRYGIHEFNPILHKNDLMFQHHLRKMPAKGGEALFHYFNVGLDALQKIQKLKQPEEVKSLLDFGAGYGRGSRFLPHFFPQAKVFVSEIKQQALRFQAEEFGFQTLSHTEDPDSFPGGKFDLVMAISVFSHLPEELAIPWLKSLYNNLNEGGMLFFTFNNLRYQPQAKQDYLFITQSEDQGMSWVQDRISDSKSYGSAFYSDERIVQIIVNAIGEKPEVIEVFSGQQDAAIITRQM